MFDKGKFCIYFSSVYFYRFDLSFPNFNIISFSFNFSFYLLDSIKFGCLSLILLLVMGLVMGEFGKKVDLNLNKVILKAFSKISDQKSRFGQE